MKIESTTPCNLKKCTLIICTLLITLFMNSGASAYEYVTRSKWEEIKVRHPEIVNSGLFNQAAFLQGMTQHDELFGEDGFDGFPMSLKLACYAGHDVTGPIAFSVGYTTGYIVIDFTDKIFWAQGLSDWENFYRALNGVPSGRYNFERYDPYSGEIDSLDTSIFANEFDAAVPRIEAMVANLDSIEEQTKFFKSIYDTINSGNAAVIKDPETNYVEIVLPLKYQGRNCWIGTDLWGEPCVEVEKTETEKAIDRLNGNWDVIIDRITGMTTQVINGVTASHPLTPP
jgi:hypothetical protein